MFMVNHLAGFGAVGQPESNDPYYASVALLASYEVDFTDAKGNAETLVNTPTIVSGTPSPPTGASNSAKFVGASSQYVHYGNSSDLNTGTGDWTAELFFYVTTISTGTNKHLITKGNLNAANAWNLFCGDTAVLRFFADTSTGVDISGGTISINTWYHAAVCRESGTWSLFFDGSRLGTSTNEGATDLGSTANFGVFGNGEASRYQTGNASYVRITKGVARYSGATYTPPTIPTSY